MPEFSFTPQEYITQVCLSAILILPQNNTIIGLFLGPFCGILFDNEVHSLLYPSQEKYGKVPLNIVLLG